MLNTKETYGLLSRILHWGMAVAIFAMLPLGLWVTSVDYEDPLYDTLPQWHETIGALLFVLLLFRIIWRFLNPKPKPLSSDPLQRIAAELTHLSFYFLILALIISGYLIITAGGRPLIVLGTIEIPALITAKGLEYAAGKFHYYIAFAVIGLATLHAAMAVYHHVVKKDSTLVRMTTGKKNSNHIKRKTNND